MEPPGCLQLFTKACLLTACLAQIILATAIALKSPGPQPFKKVELISPAILHRNTTELNMRTVAVVDEPAISKPPAASRASREGTRSARRTDENNDEGLQLPSSVIKPSGTLYVDSVHNIPVTPLQMGGTPTCDLGDQPLDADPHELSSSHFGFPKSIVNKAVEDSPFVSIFRLMATQQYYDGYRPSETNTIDKQNGGNRYDLHKGMKPSDPLSENKSYNPFDRDTDPGTTGEDANPSSIYSPDGRKGRTDVRGENSKFASLSGYTNNLSSNRQRNDGITRLVPHLLEGSVFHSSKKPDIGRNNRMPANVNDDNAASHKPNLIVNSNVRSLQNSDSADKKPVDDGNSNKFNKDLPDASRGLSWISPFSTHSLNSFIETEDKGTLPYRKHEFSGIIENLFPPKKSDNFPTVAGIKDLIPKQSPDTKDANKRKDKQSPFEIDIKSLFGSLSSSNTGIANAYKSSNLSPSSSSSSLPGSFGFLFKDNSLRTPKVQDTSSSRTGFISFSDPLKRRKREIRSADNLREADTCQGSYHVLRQYRNHGGACFVVLPDVQRITFAVCPNSSCAGCRVSSGTSRCSAVRVPTWVWAYCESGSGAGTVRLDRVQVSVACTCKVAYCRRIPLGRS